MAKTATPRDVVRYFKAGYSAIVLNTVEEVRTLKSLQRLAADEGAAFWVCSVTEGMLRMASSNGDQAAAERLEVSDCVEMMDAIMGRKGGTKEWFALLDLDDWAQNDPLLQRKIRDLVHRLGSTARRVIFIQPNWTIPLKLEREVTILDLGLPDTEELRATLDRSVGTYREAIEDKVARGEEVEPYDLPDTDDAREGLIEAARGMTVLEAENAYSLSFQNHRRFDIESVSAEKMQILKKSGLIEIVPAPNDLSRVGGHDVLKDWLMLRRRAFDAEARDYGLQQPKGALVVGHPGTGKSLVAKCVASAWGFILVRVDLGGIYGGVVGESEANMKRVLAILDSLGRVVVWLDELDKGLAQPKGAIAGGGEVTKHVLGIFITWLQEKQTPTFCIATANDVDQLPAELLRAGRFDKVWFSGMPTVDERVQIAGILLGQVKRNPAKFDLDRLAYESEGFVGSEIEQCIYEGMNVAYADRREVTTTDVADAMMGFTPLSRTASTVFEERERWAKNKATPTSSATRLAGHSGAGEPRAVEV